MSKESPEDYFYKLADKFTSSKGWDCDGAHGGGGKRPKKKRDPNSKTSQAAREGAVAQSQENRLQSLEADLQKVLKSLLVDSISESVRQKIVTEYLEWVLPHLHASAGDAASGSDTGELFSEAEMIVETYAASRGAGGQNVNKVNTAARIHHLPTGLTVESRSHRTQKANIVEAKTRLARLLSDHLSDFMQYLDLKQPNWRKLSAAELQNAVREDGLMLKPN